jgi:hypothetical protein
MNTIRSTKISPLIVLAVLVLAAATASAEPLPRHPLAKEELFIGRADDDTGDGHHLLIVKFSDSVQARAAADGRVISKTGHPLAGLAEVGVRHPFSAEQLIHLAEDRLAALEQRAAERSGRAQPDLAGMLLLRPAASNNEALLHIGQELLALPSVEFVELMAVGTPPPADIPPTTPDHTALQTYFGPDPGLNLPTSASGGGIRLSDCEYGWVYSHEDLEDIDLHPEPGQTIHPDVIANNWDEHGTAAFGSSAAAVNDYGASGMAPGAEFYTFPEWTVEGGPRRVTAITNAIAGSAAGDVVLLEMQEIGAGGSYAPAEVDMAVWTVVKTGTDAGVVVVGAAGNGAQDLDSGPYQEYRDRGDSGAILVGAGSATVAHDRLSFSTYGSRVNVQAWGHAVFTLGYGDFAQYGGDKNQRYTGSFSGTSSASGLVAGAVTVVQNAAIAYLGSPLDPVEMRQLLIDTGIPQGSGGHIGPALDVTAAIDQLASAIFTDGFESGDTTAWSHTLP